MMQSKLAITSVLMLAAGSVCEAQTYDYDLVSISEFVPEPPPLGSRRRVAGARFKEFLDAYQGSDIYHVVYLPTNWREEETYPVIFEYAGNTPARHPDKSIGRAEGCKLGFGISAGKDCIWVCLPYVGADGKTYQKQWWGDVEATVSYCKTAVRHVCEAYGGDRGKLFLAGFSRGAIACNFLGLHDDEVAATWCGFICHSHYDGARTWSYPGSDAASAAARLARLGDRPQFISHERSSGTSLAQTRPLP